MRWNIFFLIALILSSCVSFSQKKDFTKPRKVNASIKKLKPIQLFYTNPYCGGIKPSDEMLAWYSKEHPLASTHLILTYNDTIKFFTLTDSLGFVYIDTTFSFVTISLDSSHPCVLLPAPTCPKYYERPLTSLKKEDFTLSKITIPFRCNPCEPFGGKRP